MKKGIYLSAPALYATIGGIVTLLGWAWNIPRLTDWAGNGISMLPNMALATVSAGLALLLLQFGYRRPAVLLGAFTGLVGGATLFQHITTINLGIDSLLFSRSWGQNATFVPGRMGPPGSTCLFLIGAGLALSGMYRKRPKVIVAAALLVLCISMLSIIGYIFKVDLLYSVPRLTTIALPTATTLFALGIGLILSVPEVDPMKTLCGNSGASALVRRALPFLILVPIFIGWLRLMGQNSGFYDLAFGTALRTITEVVLLVGMLWWAAAAVRAHELTMRESEQRYRTLFSSMNEGFCIIEVRFDDLKKAMDYRFLEINPAFEKQTGLRDAQGKWMRELVPALEEYWFDLFGKVALTGEPARIENHAKALGRWYEVFAVRVGPAEDHRVGVVFNDITERRNSELELRNSEVRKDAILRSALDAIITMDHEGKFVEFNPAAEKLFGYSRNETLGKPLADLIIPQRFRQKHSQGLARYLATGEGPVVNRQIELPALRRDGSEFPAELAILPIPGSKPPMFTAFLRDITERKQTEKILRESKATLDFTLESAQVGDWELDLITDKARRSLRHDQCFGYNELLPEWGSKDFLQHLHPEDRAEVEHAFRQAVSQEKEWRSECRVIWPDGSIHWIAVHGSLLPTLEGNPTRMLGIVADITARKGQEQTLRFLVDLSAATQRLAEPDQIMALTAQRLAQHLGTDRCAYAEVENENVFVITGDFAQGVPSIVGRWPVAAFGKECTRLMLANEPYVVVDVDTDPRVTPEDLPAYRATTIQAVICVPLHKAGKFTAAIAVHQTRPRHWTPEEIELVQLVVGRCWESLERARTIRSLQASEQRLRFMAESMPQKIFTASPNGEIDYYNPQWMEFTGLSFDQIIGWGWKQFIHPDDLEENVQRWKHSVETGDYFQIEHRFRRHDGIYRWHLTRAHPLRGPNNDILMWIGSNTDIDDQKRAEEKLERTVQSRTAELREINEQLEAFVYSIAHDLRSPLRSMLGFSHILLEDYASSLDDVARNYLKRINQSSEFMDKLIMDLLAFGRTSRADLEFEPVSVLSAWENALFQCGTEIERTNAQVEALQPFPTVRAHAATLSQVLANLLSNGLKFIDPEVQPRIRFWAEEKGGMVRLWVQDNGVGIPREHHERVFRVFERLHGGRFAGTGIGLSIVRKGVERMNGKIGLESEPGGGSRFWIELPKG